MPGYNCSLRVDNLFFCTHWEQINPRIYGSSIDNYILKNQYLLKKILKDTGSLRKLYIYLSFENMI